jgi:hypothetical protein
MRVILFPRDWRLSFEQGCIIASFTAGLQKDGGLMRRWFTLLRFWPRRKSA